MIQFLCFWVAWADYKHMYTLPGTNMAPEKGWLEDGSFPFGIDYIFGASC